MLFIKKRCRSYLERIVFLEFKYIFAVSLGHQL